MYHAVSRTYGSNTMALLRHVGCFYRCQRTNDRRIKGHTGSCLPATPVWPLPFLAGSGHDASLSQIALVLLPSPKHATSFRIL